MDPDTEEIHFDFPPYIRQYKSGRVVRYGGADAIPAGTDPHTGVTSKDVVIDPDTAVSVRVYLPRLDGLGANVDRLPVLVYYHGGGFVVGSAANPATHAYFNDLVSRANVVGVSVDYRLAPEHPLPIAYEDSWAALKWVASHVDGNGMEPWLAAHGDFSRLFLAGCSAGSNIAHNMAARAGADGLALPAGVVIEGMVSIHPFFAGKEPIASPAERAWSEATWRFVCPETSGLDDPLANPFAPGAVSAAMLRCERVLVCVAEKDELKDRGLWYYEGLKAGGYGGEVELFESKGEDHAFHFKKLGCEKAVELQARTVAFIKK